MTLVRTHWPFRDRFQRSRHAKAKLAGAFQILFLFFVYVFDYTQVYFPRSAHRGVHLAAVSLDDLRFVRFVRASTGPWRV